MKIVLYIPSLDKGGPNRVFVELANGLTSLGNEVIVITNKSNGYYNNSIQLPIQHLSLNTISKYPYKPLAKLIREIKPDVTLVTLSAIITITIVRILFRIPRLVVIRPSNHFTQNSVLLLKKNPIIHSLSFVFNLFTFYLSDHIVCQSNDLLSDYKKYFIKEQKMTVIPNPIRVSPNTWLSDSAEQPIDLIAIGRLFNAQKGFDVLVHALKIVVRVYPNVTLHIYGEGPDRQSLENLIDDLQLQKNIKLMGYCEDILPKIASAKFLVCSSNIDAFPNVILEALSIGVPVIATDASSGIRDLVIPGRTGWLCAPKSKEELSASILLALNSNQLDKSSILAYISDNFSTSLIAQKYSQLFESISKKI